MSATRRIELSTNSLNLEQSVFEQMSESHEVRFSVVLCPYDEEKHGELRDCGNISAQAHASLSIQLKENQNDGENDRLALGLRFFLDVWAYMEIFPWSIYCGRPSFKTNEPWRFSNTLRVSDLYIEAAFIMSTSPYLLSEKLTLQ